MICIRSPRPFRSAHDISVTIFYFRRRIDSADHCIDRQQEKLIEKQNVQRHPRQHNTDTHEQKGISPATAPAACPLERHYQPRTQHRKPDQTKLERTLNDGIVRGLCSERDARKLVKPEPSSISTGS